MRSALRMLAATVVAALMPLAHGANYQGLWWNASESGWGLNIAHQGDTMMVTWFAYDDLRQGTWLVATANRSGPGTYSGTVYRAYEMTGPYFASLPFDPARVMRTPVGEATLAFSDDDNGSLQYSVGGIRGAKGITRQVFGPVPACSHAAQPELANAGNYTDLWWVAAGAESGWGINLAHQGDTIFATWFTYDAFGAPRWLVAVAPRIAGNVYSGTLLRTTGPPMSAPAFDASTVTRVPAGTATFTFSNGNAATLTATVDGATITKALTRELFAAPAGTRCTNATGTAIQGRVFEARGVAATVCADLNANGLCDAGEPQATSGADGRYTLVADAAYPGPLVAETAAGYRMVSPGRDYSASITPYTTLVQLTRERDLAIAEMMVRNELGLPQRFALRLDAPPAEGSLAQSMAGSIVTGLKAANAGLADRDALARVVAAFPKALTDLPQVRITTQGGAPIDSKDVYVDAAFALTIPAAATPELALTGKIRGRGNVTWLQPKKPYKVQLAKDSAYAALADVLGMPKSRNWALLADYLDRSLMRNQLAFTLGNSSLFAEGLKYTPQTVRVEVWLNGEYEGLYTLVQDVRVDTDRLDLKTMGANDVDGGYLVEVDWPLDCYNDGAINLQHHTPQDVHVCLKTPDETAATPAQVAWIGHYIDAAERDLYERNATDRLNLTSYADWYLLNEYLRNYDAAFFSSDYMWKDTAAAAIPGDRLLNMGPIWDFDISAGNINTGNGWMPQGCWVSVARIPTPAYEGLNTYLPNWYTKLRENRPFVDLAIARWKDKQAALGRLTEASIATWERRLSAAATRNFERWPLMGVMLPIDMQALQTWPQHVGYLEDFLGQRRAWMGQAFDSAASFAAMCQ